MSNYPPPADRRGWGPVIVAVVAGAGIAVLAVVGWTVFLLTRDGDPAGATDPGSSGSPAAGPSGSYLMAGKVAWSAPATGAEQDRAVRQAWSTADLVVYLDRVSGQVRALDKAGGTERWGFRVEGTDPDDTQDRVCAASSTAVDGAVAITFKRPADKPYGDCTSLMLLDLATGKPRWTKANVTLGSSVEIGAGVVLSSWKHLVAFDTATGKQRWSTDPAAFPGACGSAHNDHGFRLVAAGARTLVARLGCTGGQEVWTLDARNGRPVARARVAGEDLSFLGTDPVAVLVDKSTVRVLSPDGRRVARSFTITEPGGRIGLPGSIPLVWRWKSYLITGDNAMGSAIEAWDVRSGRPVWTTRVKRATTEDDPTGIRGTLPRITGVDDEGVVCLLTSIGEDTAVARLDLTTGKQTDLTPVFTQQVFTPLDQAWWFWDGKRLAAVRGDNPSSNSQVKDIAFAIE